jgi:hypothetical protein
MITYWRKHSGKTYKYDLMSKQNKKHEKISHLSTADDREAKYSSEEEKVENANERRRTERTLDGTGTKLTARRTFSGENCELTLTRPFARRHLSEIWHSAKLQGGPTGN